MIKYIGFDKDGTLFNTMDSYAKIWGEIFYKQYGIDAKNAGKFLIKTAGQPNVVQVDTLLRRNNIILSEKDVFKKSNEITTILGEKTEAKLFPEVAKVLRELKKERYKIFISSGQQEKVIKNDLKQTGLKHYIDFIAGIKPENPNYKKGESHFRAAASHFGILFETFVKETVFIGDTQTDIEVAINSNILCIIRGNKVKEEQFKEMGAKIILNDFSSLPDVLKTL